MSLLPKERIDIWADGEYSYPLAFGFKPNFRTYIHSDDQIRPAVIVVPGGAYWFVSPTEAGIVAEKFYDYGFNAFVFTYTTNMLELEPLKDQPMRDLARAVRLIRKNADHYKIDPGKIALCGFSAGAHLCGSLCVHFSDVSETDPELSAVSCRPDAAILSYPVITSGDKCHQGSFDALLGFHPSPEELQYYSLETQVTKDTPPCFLWQTAPDEAVPVENSYLFAAALKENGVVFEHHVFPRGHHGISLADEKWAANDVGDPYTTEQTVNTIAAVKSGAVEATEEMKAMVDMFSQEGENRPKEEPVPEATIWPLLAKNFLEVVFERR